MKRTIVLATLLALCACLPAAASTPVVTVNFPANGSTVHGPVYYAASASSSSCAKGIASMRIYSAPSISAYTVNAAQFSTFISLSPGTYNTVVQSWDYCGGVGKTPVTVTVSSSGGVTVYTPAVNNSAASPIHFVASASAVSTCAKGIASMRIYSAPGVKAYTVNSNGLDTFLSLPSGTYSSTIQAWDKCGGVYKTPVTVTAQNSPGHTLYMATSDLNYVSQYLINDGGFLQPAIQLPMPNGPPQDFVTDRLGVFAYATVALGIEAFSIDRTTGALIEVPGSPFAPAGSGPFKLAMDPQGNFVYVTFSASNTVSSYRINRNSGALKLNGSAAAGNGAGAVKTDPSGKFLYVANSVDNTISAYGVDWTSGALKPIAGSPFASGYDPNVFAVSNGYLYLFGGNNLSGSPKSISAYAIDTASGVLTPVPGSPFTGHGSPANYIAVDAVHNVLYQPTFPAPLSDAININTIDPATGAITFVDITAEFQEQNAEAMLVDFSGDYLYMIDNFTGSESSPTAVGSFAIDPVTGQLSPLGTHYQTASHNSYASLAVVP